MKDLLIQHLQTMADPQVKSWWENYVEQSAPFRGVKMAQLSSFSAESLNNAIKNYESVHKMEIKKRFKALQKNEQM